MPPYLPRKRLREGSEEPRDQTAAKKHKGKAAIAPPRKSTLFDALDDAASSPRPPTRDGSAIFGDDNDDSSSLSSLSEADFEDVPGTKQHPTGPRAPDEEEDGDEDEDIEFEDVQAPHRSVLDTSGPSRDLVLTLSKNPTIQLSSMLEKKGPSKRDRQIRITTHCLHVQFLLRHNAIRNKWLCDQEVQGIMLSHLTPRLWQEIDRWRLKSGLEAPDEQVSARKGGQGGAKGGGAKGKGRDTKSKKDAAKPQRDWGDAADRLERGVADLSHGDPLFQLMKALASWWKQRFHITAPGIRKVGYMDAERLGRYTRAYKQEPYDFLRFGERIPDLDHLRQRALACAGSRDVGAQLFTALLRGLGLEARMVASLQPTGFGWNKLEEADPEKEDSTKSSAPSLNVGIQHPEIHSSPAGSVTTSKSRKTKPANGAQQDGSKRSRRTTARKEKIESEDSEDFEFPPNGSDDDSVIELPTRLPKKGKSFDKDLEYPHYWTEVLSPVTNRYLVVDPIVKSVVGTNRESVESIEPRGGKADKARQVIAYVVGFSPDGTAKDVTVRYLKRQVLPGRTKGMRMPIEKVPVYNRHGKVKRHELFDWFKFVLRAYARGSREHPYTEVDDDEDATDLKPNKPEKKEVKEGEETLQYYKQSAEFVLEKHLKREEALLPTAKPAKTFKNKSKGATTEEPVYLRKDVVQVKSAETWHKQGRAPTAGEQPLKRVPYRAATTNRRREIAEAEALTGEKALQGLFSFDQTEWIIPPPIENGIIPKNEYGNIDLFAKHMCPEGAVHVPFRGAVRVCKRLEIDYAEAVVDFEFGHRMAVPVIQGVVIAEEYHDQVMTEIAKDEAERSRKEDEKRKKTALGMWRKLLMGLRISERLIRDYGGMKEGFNVFGHDRGDDMQVDTADTNDEDMAGGFLPEGYEDEPEKEAHQISGFFPVGDEEGEEGGEDTLEVDHGDHGAVSRPRHVPRQTQKAKPKRTAASKAKAKKTTATTRRRQRAQKSSDEEEPEDDDYEEDDFDE